MSRYEKRLLRELVKSGHSPYENPRSKYLCLTGSESYDFLTIQRMDKEVEHAMKGMSMEEQKTYLMEYMGWTDKEPEHESADFCDPEKNIHSIHSSNNSNLLNVCRHWMSRSYTAGGVLCNDLHFHFAPKYLPLYSITFLTR